jgi:hypothetical protein
MVDRESDHDGDRVGVSRRRFLETTGAAGAAVGLAGCSGGGDDGGDGDDPIQITMDGEWTGFEDSVIDALYEAGLDEEYVFTPRTRRMAQRESVKSSRCLGQCA